jgi:hypothetical protein
MKDELGHDEAKLRMQYMAVLTPLGDDQDKIIALVMDHNSKIRVDGNSAAHDFSTSQITEAIQCLPLSDYRSLLVKLYKFVFSDP